MSFRANSPALRVEQLEDRLTPAGSVIPAGEFNWTQYSPTGELGQLVWNGGTLVYRARVSGALCEHLLVDDHAVVRRGVRAFLETQPGIGVVAVETCCCFDQV